MKSIFSILFVGFLLSGCTHLASVSTSSIPKSSQRGQVVSTQAKRGIFLGFNFNNDYVNDISFNLAKQCPKGKVQGVVTKHEVVWYFLPFYHEVRVSANGYCTRG